MMATTDPMVRKLVHALVIFFEKEAGALSFIKIGENNKVTT
jgi:hypothetical protein